MATYRRGYLKPPNLAAIDAPDSKYCYACGQQRPARLFRRDCADVCTPCRSTRAYQEPLVMRHMTRWCKVCASYEPLTAFWNQRKSGMLNLCGKHQAEQKAEIRRSRLGVDGYRKRWLHELRTLIRCTHCGERANLCFVHLDPSTKLFTISGAEHNRTVDQIKAELRKCDVLCRDCMTEVTQSTLWKQGLARSTPATDWTALFAAVDAVVEPLAKPRRTTQLALTLE